MRRGFKIGQWAPLILLVAFIIGDLMLLMIRGKGLIDIQSQIGVAELIQLFVTVTLVVVTAYYADSAKTQADASLKMAQEMERTRIQAVRPSLSLWPADYTFGGDFSSLSLRNSGGVAKDVKIDFKTTKPDSSESLFIPAIDEDSMVILHSANEVQREGGKLIVELNFKDSLGQLLNDKLEIDFGNLRHENRKLAFQTSIIGQELRNITRNLEGLNRAISALKSH